MSITPKLRNRIVLGVVLVLLLGPIALRAKRGVTPDKWIRYLDTKLRESAGKACGGYVSECYDVGQSECNSVADSSARKCLGEISKKLPAEIEAPEEKKWRYVLVGCIEEKVKDAVAAKKKRSPVCETERAWMESKGIHSDAIGK